MNIERWPGSAPGRSRAVAHGQLVWLVANSTDAAGDFRTQAEQTLAMVDASLQQARSDRSRMLSVQVWLHDVANKPLFDTLWQQWIGPDPASWPQRSCLQAGLAPGLLLEVVVVAARE